MEAGGGEEGEGKNLISGYVKKGHVKINAPHATEM